MFNFSYSMLNDLAAALWGDIALIFLVCGGAVALTFVGIKGLISGKLNKFIIDRYLKKAEDKKFIDSKIKKTQKRYTAYRLKKTKSRERKYRNMLYVLSEANINLASYRKFFENLEDDCFKYNVEKDVLKNTKLYNLLTGKCERTEALKIAQKRKAKTKETQTTKYIVSFDPNGGKFNGKDLNEILTFELNKGTKMFMPDNSKIRMKNYSLVGWETLLQDGSNDFYDPRECFFVGKKNVVFKAIWKQEESVKSTTKKVTKKTQKNNEEEKTF